MPAKLASKPAASKLNNVGGRLVSAKSKTGNPLCSQAMSAWVRSRHGGAAVGAEVFKMLAKCRAMAKQNKGAAQKQASGKLAPGRGTWQRSTQAGDLWRNRQTRLQDVARASFAGRPIPGVSTEQANAAARAPMKAQGRGTLERVARAKAYHEERANSAIGRAALAKATAKTRDETMVGGVVIKGEPGNAPQSRISTARFTAARKTKAEQLRSERDPKMFASRVQGVLAGVVKSGGNGKVFISDAHKAYQQAHGPIPIDRFKAQLLQAQNGRHLDLARADMPEAMNAATVKASTTKHAGGSEFHFIRGKAPSLREQAATHRTERKTESRGTGTHSSPEARHNGASLIRAQRNLAVGRGAESRVKAAGILKELRRKGERYTAQDVRDRAVVRESWGYNGAGRKRERAGFSPEVTGQRIVDSAKQRYADRTDAYVQHQARASGLTTKTGKVSIPGIRADVRANLREGTPTEKAASVIPFMRASAAENAKQARHLHQALEKSGVAPAHTLAAGRTIGEAKKRWGQNLSRLRTAIKGNAEKPKPAAPTKPSLRDQAAASRAAKGTREQRLGTLASRQSGYATNATKKVARAPEKTPLFGGASEGPLSAASKRASSNAIATRDHKLGRAAKLRKVLEGTTAPKPEPAFSLKASSSSGGGLFGSSGGRTGSLFDEMRGAASRDLPGQRSMFGSDERTRVNMAATPAPMLLRPMPSKGGKITQPRGQAERIAAERQKDSERLRAVLTKNQAHRDERAKQFKRIRSQRDEAIASKGSVQDLPTSSIHFDPNRFQYKLSAQGDHGVTDALQGVKRWDPNLGGVLQVWKDPSSGKTFVVNGHHRLDLARKLGADKVSVRYLDAPSAEHARSIGALTNIAEGRGNSLDAAKFFRDTGHNRAEIEAKGIPMKEKVATEGLALSQLHPKLFDRVVNQDMTPARGAIIGGAGLEHHHQEAIAKLIDKQPKSRPISDKALGHLVDNAKMAPTVKEKTRDLFGTNEEDHSLLIHRANAAALITDRLGREKRVFGTVAQQRNANELERVGNVINTDESGKISAAASQNLQTFHLLKDRSGPVAKLLNHAAERVHAGEKAKAVHDDTYRKLPAAIQEMLDGRA